MSDIIGIMKTSDLIAALAADPARLAIAAEIDRRMPVPDPRIGKLFRLLSWDGKIARCVAVEPGGALRFREDGWSPSMCDYRSHHDEVEPVDDAGGGK